MAGNIVEMNVLPGNKSYLMLDDYPWEAGNFKWGRFKKEKETDLTKTCISLL